VANIGKIAPNTFWFKELQDDGRFDKPGSVWYNAAIGSSSSLKFWDIQDIFVLIRAGMSRKYRVFTNAKNLLPEQTIDALK
jgi:hypothetical protein